MPRLHALLISGDEARFVESSTAFFNYLTDLVGVPNERITTTTMPPNKNFLVDSTEDFFRKLVIGDAACVLYEGHGIKGAMTPGNYEVPYDEITRLIPRDNPLIFLNTACFSGSCIPAFKSRGLLKNGMVLAASHSHELSHGDRFIGEAVASYFNRKPFRAKAIYSEVPSDNRFTMDYDPAEKVKERIEIKNGKRFMVVEFSDRSWSLAPVIERKVLQHPIKRGRTLDHLLFRANQ